jgi:nucleoid-associated protein YgaU
VSYPVDIVGRKRAVLPTGTARTIRGGSNMTAITSVRIRALFIISITVVVVLLLLASASNASGDITDTYDYRVKSGDTLWEIAEEHGPEGVDRRKVVAAIERINDVTASSLQAGQVIEIPVITSS